MASVNDGPVASLSPIKSGCVLAGGSGGFGATGAASTVGGVASSSPNKSTAGT